MMRFIRVVLGCALLLFMDLVFGQTEALQPWLEHLQGRDFKAKAAAVSAIADSGHARSEAILHSLLEGDLYRRKSDNVIVIGQREGRQYQLWDALSGAELGSEKKRALKKLSTNNQLRSHIRTTLAKLSLFHSDPERRRAAVQQMLDKLDAEAVALLTQASSSEPVADIQELMQLGAALGELHHTDPERQLAAIAQLADSVHPTVRQRLIELSQTTEPEVAAAAQQSVARIEQRLQWYQHIETVFFGLSLGSVLLLAAIGLAITFGVMGVINMAHGELIMLGAYTTYLLQAALPQWLDYSLILAIPAAFLVSGFFGILIERGVIQFLYGRPLETLLATFGISLILQQLVRTVISAQNVPVANPSWMSGAWELNSVLALTYNRLYILLFAIALVLGLMMLLKRSVLGLQMRAVAQNRAMAQAIGIRSARVDMLTFGLGSGIAGVAGVALSQIGNVGPNLGQTYIVDSFMVVVFGGVGNLWGTVVAAFSLGVANKLMEPYAGAVLAKILVLVFLILFIQKRPQGLFPQRGRG